MYCSNCGNALEEGSLFCDMCGCKLDNQLTAQPKPQPTQTYAQPTQQYPQVTQQNAPYYQQPTQAPNQPNQPYPQNGGAPQKKKKGLVIGLIVAGIMLAAALTVFFVLILPSIGDHKDEHLPTNNEETITKNEKSTDSKDDEEGTENSTNTEEQDENEIENETQKETETEGEAEAVSEAEAETQAEPPAETPAEPPAETPTEPAKDLPYVDSLGKANASDFAWISDAMSGNLEGTYLGKDDILGKWKCEFIFDGIWELVYVTIDEGGKITVEPYQINYGEGWDDESGDASYSFTGSFDINRVYGSGGNGKIDIYKLVESYGTQYGVGTLTTNGGSSAEVYLVRP